VRNAFSDALVSLALEDPKVLLLTGDHGYALFDEFRKRCPDRYINAGIAEQNMVGMAAGLARVGFRPFVYGLSAFVPVRVVEQIKLDVAHDKLPVVFVGDGAGFVYSHLGTSHQSTEDIACLRAVPDITILSPSDRHETSAAMRFAYDCRSSVYLRLGKSDRGDVHNGPVQLEHGRLLPVGDGAPKQLLFIATGSLTKTAIELSKNYGASVCSAPVIKPLAALPLAQLLRSFEAVVTFEEHSVLGGLGSAIAEVASEMTRTPVLRIGVQDRFSHACGSYEYLLREHHLDASSIEERIRAFLASIA